VENLAGHEGRRLEIEKRVDDVLAELRAELIGTTERSTVGSNE